MLRTTCQVPHRCGHWSPWIVVNPLLRERLACPVIVIDSSRDSTDSSGLPGPWYVIGSVQGAP